MTRNQPSSASSTTKDITVLISGAGPVGTLAAILLTKLGIPVRLIERDMTVSTLSKAFSLHARTLEILEMNGLVKPFLERGHPIGQFNIYFKGTRGEFGGLANTISHYNYAIFLEQAKTTAILTEELESLGVQIDRGWELLDTAVIEQDGKSWVETTIRRALDGTNTREGESKILGVVELDEEEEGKKYETEVVRSEYLIAADGGKSVVRHRLGIAFPGRTLDNNVILFDGEVETDMDFSKITVINGANNATMNIFPLTDGGVRAMVDASHLDPTEELTVDKFEQIAQAAAAPFKFKVRSSRWLTFYRVNERQAESFSYKDRVFLMGDAAHVHSPAGGQGMNTGLQDANNLTWKLALVLHHLAPSSILSTYNRERKPVANDIIQLSANMFAMGFSQALFRRAMRKLIVTFASIAFRFIATPPSTVSMLAIRYQENLLNQPHKSQPAPAEPYQVGQRAHDGPLRPFVKGGSTGEDIRLHQLLLGPGIFHILVFTSDMLLRTNHGDQLNKDIESFLQQWRSRWSYPPKAAGAPHSLFQVHVLAAMPEILALKPDANPGDWKDTSVIHADALVSKAVGDGKAYVDHSLIVHERYGVPLKGMGAVVVLRPDSHLGYRVNGAAQQAWEDVGSYFESILA